PPRPWAVTDLYRRAAAAARVPRRDVGPPRERARVAVGPRSRHATLRGGHLPARRLLRVRTARYRTRTLASAFVNHSADARQAASASAAVAASATARTRIHRRPARTFHQRSRAAVPPAVNSQSSQSAACSPRVAARRASSLLPPPEASAPPLK